MSRRTGLATDGGPYHGEPPRLKTVVRRLRDDHKQAYAVLLTSVLIVLLFGRTVSQEEVTLELGMEISFRD